MNLPIKTLPIVEHWDCSNCGKCCRGTAIPLDDDDLAKLREQNWAEHPDFINLKTTVKQSLFGSRQQLAQRDDGTCVFLDDDGLCRIHKEHGYDAKPFICRVYPLQIVPVDNTAYLTLRRSCPTAAAEQGRELKEHRAQAKKFANERPRLVQKVQPPMLVKGRERSWQESLMFTDAIRSLLTDERFPLVRRLVHGLRFCQMLQKCRVQKLERAELGELISILCDAAPQEVGDLFRERTPPGRSDGAVFRQIAVDYLRLHPLYLVRESWRMRWRLAWSALKFTRGKGEVPHLHPDFPRAKFDDLEQPLGHLDQTIQKPLLSYFETNATSLQYAVASRLGWPLIDKFRALAITYPVVMWMLRYFSLPTESDKSSGNNLTVDQAIDMVTAIDRGQGYAQLTGGQHRRRIKSLVGLEALERLVVWYAQ